MPIFVNWLIVLSALLLFFAGLYLVVKLAVKNAVKESAHQLIEELAQKLWADDKDAEQPPQD
jgi:flagellar biogenesis protein FliO